jgi:hypothetical protein
LDSEIINNTKIKENDKKLETKANDMASKEKANYQNIGDNLVKQSK